MPDETMRPLALLGLFGIGNIGNEASLAAGIAAARRQRSHPDVIVVAGDPDPVGRQHGVAAVPISMAARVPSFDHLPRPVRLLLRPLVEVARWLSAYRFLRSVDALVVPGTGILDDFGVTPQQMPYDLLRWSAVARLAGRPWAMVGVGAGPIDHPLSRRLMRRAVKNARLVTYRDEESRAFMARLGAPGRADAVQPDVAFALPRPERREPVDGAPREIGLGVMAYYGWGNDPIAGQAVFASYIASMTEIARRILASGHAVRLLIGEQTDIRAAEQVTTALGSRASARMGHTVLFEPITTFGELMAQIARTEAVVATRYHNVIAGLMTATPTISIGYADKNRAVMSSFGLEQYCHHVDAVDVDAVERDLVAALDRGPHLRATMRDTAERLARQVDARFDATFEELVGDRGRLSPATG